MRDTQEPSNPKSRSNSLCCLFNAQSLVNKLQKFQSFVYASDCNVFCITETWLSDKISNGEILSSSYVLYRCD